MGWPAWWCVPCWCSPRCYPCCGCPSCCCCPRCLPCCRPCCLPRCRPCCPCCHSSSCPSSWIPSPPPGSPCSSGDCPEAHLHPHHSPCHQPRPCHWCFRWRYPCCRRCC